MKLKCLASGSSGNCYLLESDNEVLIMDCGIPIKDIKIGLDFDLSKVAGCVATHAHKDHSKSVEDLRKMGISVDTPYDRKYIGIGENWNFPERQYSHDYSNFNTTAFALTDLNRKFMHTNADGTECPCYGFLITHPAMGKMLYITDTELVKWRFADVDHILISCNYQKKYLSDDEAKRNHVLMGHMELETVKEFIKANRTDSLKTVILCHLSKGNANPKEMVAEVQKVAKCPVYVAEKGLEVELKDNSCPF